MLSAGAMLFTVMLSFAATQPSRNVAIMSAEVGAPGAVVDELIARLSNESTIRLVERDMLGRVSREQELAALGLATGERVKLGQLLGANVLVLVADDPMAGTNAVRMLICDSATGARIGQMQCSGNSAGVAALATEIRTVLARFPHGVQSVVAVPDLISRDLRLEHARLQTVLAELLRDALSREQGMAVVEMEEARAIAGEHALLGGELRRIVPLFVEGEYRTDALAAGEPRISLSVTLRMAARPDVKVESGRISLDEAGRFVLGTVQAKSLEFLKRPAPGNFDAAEEFNRLVRRADQFAEIGGFDRAAAMREAALLLKPEVADQRIRLVYDYCAANSELVDSWPKGAQRTASDPFWAQVVSHRRESWRRCLYHVEYLVRNRRVDISLGTKLLDGSIHSLMSVRGTEAARLKEEEELKKEFLRHVAPVLLSLPGKNDRPATQDDRSSAAYRVYDYVFLRMDGNYFAEDDLVLAGDLLCDLLPEDTPLAMKMIYALGSGTQMVQDPKRDVSAAAWLKFVQRLLNSPRPLVNAYGRYARLCDQRIRLKLATEEMLVEAKSLAAAAAAPPLSQLDPSGHLRQVASDNAVWIEMALRLKKREPAFVARPAAKGPLVQSDGTLVCERLRLKPIKLGIARQAASPGVPNNSSSDPRPTFECRGLVPVWDGVDAVYSRASVALVGRKFTGQEIFVDRMKNIGSVVFDGQHLWLSTGYDRGVYVFDPEGKQVARVGPAEGLPEAYVLMPLHPLGPGRVMAAGSIKQSQRGWLAIIELTGGRPRVNVFHEAIKLQRAYSNASTSPNLDPTLGFEPEWIMDHEDEDGKQWVFVGRNHSHQPLVVDLATMEVSVYPAGPFDKDCFPRNEPGFGVFWSQRGLLYVAGSNRDFKAFRFDPKTHRFTKALDRPSPDWHYGNARQGCVAEHEGYLYYTGNQRWLRYEIADGREEILVASPRALPDYGSGDSWTLGISNVAGLVAWHQGKLYQLSVEPGAKTSAAQPLHHLQESKEQ